MGFLDKFVGKKDEPKKRKKSRKKKSEGSSDLDQRILDTQAALEKIEFNPNTTFSTDTVDEELPSIGAEDPGVTRSAPPEVVDISNHSRIGVSEAVAADIKDEVDFSVFNSEVGEDSLFAGFDGEEDPVDSFFGIPVLDISEISSSVETLYPDKAAAHTALSAGDTPLASSNVSTQGTYGTLPELAALLDVVPTSSGAPENLVMPDGVRMLINPPKAISDAELYLKDLSDEDTLTLKSTLGMMPSLDKVQALSDNIELFEQGRYLLELIEEGHLGAFVLCFDVDSEADMDAALLRYELTAVSDEEKEKRLSLYSNKVLRKVVMDLVRTFVSDKDGLNMSPDNMKQFLKYIVSESGQSKHQADVKAFMRHLFIIALRTFKEGTMQQFVELLKQELNEKTYLSRAVKSPIENIQALMHQITVGE